MSGSLQSESPGVTTNSFGANSFLEKIEMWFHTLTSLLYCWKPGSLVSSVASFLDFCRLTYVEGLQHRVSLEQRQERLALAQTESISIHSHREVLWPYFSLYVLWAWMADSPAHPLISLLLSPRSLFCRLPPPITLYLTHICSATHMCTGQSSEDGKGWAELPGCVRLEIWITAISRMESLQGQHDIF